MYVARIYKFFDRTAQDVEKLRDYSPGRPQAGNGKPEKETILVPLNQKLQ